MVTPPCASIVKTSPLPPVYVICSSSAGEFWFSPTVVHVPTRQGSTAAAVVAEAAEVAVPAGVAAGDVVEDPPHAARAIPVDARSAITRPKTIADRARVRSFIANSSLSGARRETGAPKTKFAPHVPSCAQPPEDPRPEAGTRDPVGYRAL